MKNLRKNGMNFGGSLIKNFLRKDVIQMNKKKKKKFKNIQKLLNEKLASIGVRPGGHHKPGSGNWSAYLGKINRRLGK